MAILMAGGPKNGETISYCGERTQLHVIDPMPSLPDSDAGWESLTPKVTYEVYNLEQLAIPVASKDPLLPPNVCTMRVYRHSSVPADSLYSLVMDIFKEFPLTRFYATHVPFWSKKV